MVPGQPQTSTSNLKLFIEARSRTKHLVRTPAFFPPPLHPMHELFAYCNVLPIICGPKYKVKEPR